MTKHVVLPPAKPPPVTPQTNNAVVIGVSVAVVIAAIAIIVGSLAATGVIGGSSGGGGTDRPPVDLFDCTRPIAGDPNALYWRIQNQAARMFVQNGSGFLDYNPANRIPYIHFGASFFFRLPSYTLACTSASSCPNSVYLPLWSRNDNINPNWDIGVKINPTPFNSANLWDLQVFWQNRYGAVAIGQVPGGLQNLRNWNSVVYTLRIENTGTVNYVSQIKIWWNGFLALNASYGLGTGGDPLTRIAHPSVGALNLGSREGGSQIGFALQTTTIVPLDIMRLIIFNRELSQGDADNLISEENFANYTDAPGTTQSYLLGTGDPTTKFFYTASTSNCIQGEIKGDVLLKTTAN